MTAGLPRSAKSLAIVFFMVAILSLSAVVAIGEDVQTASYTQTGSYTLDSVLTRVTGTTLLPPNAQFMLVVTITGAVDAGVVTPADVDALLDIALWGSITDVHQAKFAAQAISSVLDLMLTNHIGFNAAQSYLETAITTGDIAKIPMARSGMSQYGIQTAILQTADKFSYSQDDMQAVQTKVGEVIKAGVPAGIALRTVISLIRTGATPDDILAALDELTTSIAQGTSPGQAANGAAATGDKGQHPPSSCGKVGHNGNEHPGPNSHPCPPNKGKKHHGSDNDNGKK